MAKSCKTKTILIIEDEADVRHFASRVLELEDVTDAVSGETEHES